MQSLYLSLLSDEFLSQARERENNRVYNTPVVMLLMILQRLQSGARTMSTNTDAYNNARQKLPLQAVEEFADNAFAQMTACTNGSLPAIARRAFVFDGTTVRTTHTKALRQLYPPTSNQEGESHGPLIRMLVAHDVTTGLGMRPEWGAVNGPHAVSEQRLLEQAVQRLPEQAVVVRMTAARAKSMLKGPLRDGIDKRIDWKPTKLEANQGGPPNKPRIAA